MPQNPPDTSLFPWRLNVGMVILNQTNHVWMGRRPGTWDYAWQFPQGGIHEGETPEIAMWRELEEEVGITEAEILSIHPTWLRYSLPHDKAIEHGYQGQQQMWFLIRYAGDDSIMRTNEEFSTWAWVPWRDLDTIIKTMIVPFKRDVYIALLNQFSKHIPAS